MENHCWCVILSAVCILFVMMTVRADGFGDDEYNKFSTRKLCGTKLSDTLRTVCDGAYNSMYKKSENDQDYMYQSDQPDPSLMGYGQQQLPFLPRREASRLYPRQFRRYARGIIQECCKKPCSLGELRTYCDYRAR